MDFAFLLQSSTYYWLTAPPSAAGNWSGLLAEWNCHFETSGIMIYLLYFYIDWISEYLLVVKAWHSYWHNSCLIFLLILSISSCLFENQSTTSNRVMLVLLLVMPVFLSIRIDSWNFFQVKCPMYFKRKISGVGC